MSKKINEEPLYVKIWRKIDFPYVDIEDGYVRVSNMEYDVVGATVIYFDGSGAFKAYYIQDDKENEVAIEFTPEMSKALYKTWKWLRLDWVK